MLFLVACCLIAYCIFLQFLSPGSFYESDSYYHIAVSRFIKDLGFNYQFRWAQFSTYKDTFADKDFLFHLLSVSFLFLSNDIVIAGKYAIIFYNALFIVVFAFILRKYLPYYLTCCFLLLPFLSATFTTYLLYLRSFTLANIFTLLAIYFLINKRLIGLFIICLLYPLSHTSFFTVVLFAFMCEIIRYAIKREFFFRNVYICAIATILGCFIHPNFPRNLLYLHLQFLVIDYASRGIDLALGSELYSYPTMRVLVENFAVFLSPNIVLWFGFFARRKISFATAVWFACLNFYLVLAFTADRHWYTVNILIFIFLASYLEDCLDTAELARPSLKVISFIALYLVAAIAYFPAGLRSLEANIDLNTRLGSSYKDASLWMKKNIPAGETIYHNNWSDSAYFLCFDPDHNYLVVLDPVYMYYRYPGIFLFYRDLSRGQIPYAYAALKDVFKTNYGYTTKDSLFFARIKQDPKHFKILYEDTLGVVFKI